MKTKIEKLIFNNPQFNQFLNYIDIASQSPYFSRFKPAAIRAFYFDIDFEIDENRSLALLLDPSVSILIAASFLTRILKNTTFEAAIAIVENHDMSASNGEKISNLKIANDAMMIAIKIALHYVENLDIEKQLKLKEFQKKITDHPKDNKEFKKEIADQARGIAKEKCPHINLQKQDQDVWKFTQTEKELRKQYYFANLLLVECLKSRIMISPEDRKNLEASLLISQLAS